MSDHQETKQEPAGSEAETATPKSQSGSTIEKLKLERGDLLERLSAEFGGAPCYPFFFSSSISRKTVNRVYEELREQYGDRGERLVVVVHSGGGDIDAAYNLAHLFRRYGSDSLIFVVPRWAKSAATLMVCGGDKILVTPVAELGPVDPQITEFNPLENRLEQFSPLHIQSTLELIAEEYAKGNQQLADGLMKRLQFPLTLGSFRKSLEIGKEYLHKLLSSRMFAGEDDAVAEAIAVQLSTGYVNHGFCINCPELETIQLKYEQLEGDALDLVWRLFVLNEKERELEKDQKKREVLKELQQLPPEVRELLRDLPLDQVLSGENGSSSTRKAQADD